jgi:protein Tex
MLTTDTLFRISKEVGASVSRVEATVSLLEGGATVPFIARYRKEATGNLDEVKILDIDECRIYYTELDQRRAAILAAIEKQGKLTDELKQKIQGCFSKSELEDLYLPFKQKKKTKAGAAIAMGLGPLADYIWEQTGSDPVGVYAERFVSPPEPEPEPSPEPVVVPVAEPVAESVAEPASEAPESEASPASETVAEAAPESAEPPVEAAPAPPVEAAPAPPPAPVAAKPAPKKRINNVQEAIEGALHILAERIAENPESRKYLRDKLMLEGTIRAHVVPGKESEKTKYEMYYKFEETVPKIPSHRMLAIRRGTRENVLTYTIETDSEKFLAWLMPQIIKDSDSQFAPFLDRAVRDSYERLMAPSIRNEARTALRERSESEAIKVFEENLKTLLLAPPAGPISTLGIDPGIRTGCKVAVVDETGTFLDSQVLQLSDPGKDLEAAEKTLTELVTKHNVRAITIGNGTASREAEAFVRGIAQKNGWDIVVVVVSEAGASVYSASKRAREEFPKLDVTVRGAISIARRLQDPLAELVKIEPRSIGVGQYQHDVDQRKLKHSLEGAVASCVNRVGVDLNTASQDLLKYVSGINDKLAGNIIGYRTQSGMFRSRAQLRDIEGFGDKTFEQAAGFLRIKDGENPLDRTAVHPESYPIVEKLAASLNVAVADLIANSERVNAADFKALEGEAGKFTLSDIREELLRPGRDPRDKFVAPKFREDVKQVVDLQEGMELEGSVTNVTNFGAFVDLGVHQDGLVHISELSHKYIQDARQAVKVGDVVKVKVIGVDQTMKRISLSIKALLPKPPRPPRRKKPQKPVAAAAAPQSATGTAERTTATSPSPERRPSRPPFPPRKPRPDGGPRPDGKPRPERSPRPVEVARPVPNQTMEEKIQALQAKFSGMK